VKVRPKPFWLATLCLVCAGTLLFGQDVTADMRAELVRRMEAFRNWNSKANTPGAELRLVELQRQQVGKDVFVFIYELHTKGLRSGLGYDLLTLPTMASSADDLQTMGEVVIDEKDGRVIDGPNDTRKMIIPDPAPGEPYRFALASKNGQYRAFASVVPKPIEGSDKGCKVSVIRLMRNFELAFVQINGFPPQSEVSMSGNSEGEVHDFTMKTNADGYADGGILPFKRGKSKGKIELQFAAPQCSPKVAFKWGKTEDGQPYQ
jgi:hypothetical protein